MLVCKKNGHALTDQQEKRVLSGETSCPVCSSANCFIKGAPGTLTIKQGLTDFNCVACCAAMATGEYLDTALSEMVRDELGGFDISELAAFMAKRKYNLGTFFEFDTPFSINTKDYNLCIDIKYSEPAILFTKPQNMDRTGMYHCVYWDGRDVRDPCPILPDLMPLSDYKIFRFLPIHKFEN